MKDLGLIHLYHGYGKGKTSAALGLAIRCAGAGMKVVIVQFLKGSYTSELSILEQISNISVLRNSIDLGFINSMTETEKRELTKMHNSLLFSALESVDNNMCDLLILDELCAAYEYNTIDKDAIDNLIINKPSGLELVITGRNPSRLFLDKADYITEMKNIRHPYDKNISARRGIEY